jgi:hypothetical protein
VEGETKWEQGFGTGQSESVVLYVFSLFVVYLGINERFVGLKRFSMQKAQ